MHVPLSLIVLVN